MRTSASDSRPTASVERAIDENQVTVDAREEQQAGRTDSPPPTEAAATDRHPGNNQPIAKSEALHPRIVEEHHLVGPNGEDGIEAIDDRGRRWYHLRPEQHRRADLMGFNYTWWVLTVILVIVAFLPWPGWGY
jgi:hypothetical protein